MNFHPSMAGIEKRRYVRNPVLRSLTEHETRMVLEMRDAGKAWEGIALALGVTRHQVQLAVAHVPTPIKRRRPSTLDRDDPGLNDDCFNTRKIAKSCDSLLEALQKYHVMPQNDPQTERPRFMRVIRPDYSYCGSPAQMCMEGRASSGGKTKTHEGAR